MADSTTTSPREGSEAEYIRLTDLAKLRIVRNILYDVLPQSLPGKQDITNKIYGAILKLETLENDD